MPAVRFAERLTEHRDILVEIPFLDELLRPYRIHELFFFHQVTTILD